MLCYKQSFLLVCLHSDQILTSWICWDSSLSKEETDNKTTVHSNYSCRFPHFIIHTVPTLVDKIVIHIEWCIQIQLYRLNVCLRYFNNKQKTNFSKVQVPSTDKVLHVTPTKPMTGNFRITRFVSSWPWLRSIDTLWSLAAIALCTLSFLIP